MTTTRSRHVYGPVPSRRLGRSLGVDLVPLKTCSYDCTYCQLGRTTDRTITRSAHVPIAEVLEELDAKLALEPAPDFISLAGSGEPTLHSQLGELIEAIKRITSTPVAVLTNGSLLWKPEVRDCLAEADLVLPSLDAGDARLFRAINRPHERIEFLEMVDGLARFTRAFRKEVWLEVLLLDGMTATSSEAEKIAALASRIAPSRVQLNTVHRPAAERSALPVSRTHLLELKKLFDGRVDIISEGGTRDSSPLTSHAVDDDEVIAMLGRRPCSAVDVARGLGIHINEALKHLERLVASGEAKIVSSAKTFYVATGKAPVS